MKKFIAVLLTVITLVNLSPRKSEAVVGAVILPETLIGIPFIVAGAFLTAGSLVVAGDRYANYHDREDAWLWFWVGVFLLDGEQGVDAVFTAVKPEEGAKLGLTSEELARYNEELPEINVIREHIVANLVTRTKKGETVDQKSAQSLWQAYSNQLSADAFSALKKVSAQGPTHR